MPHGVRFKKARTRVLMAPASMAPPGAVGRVMLSDPRLGVRERTLGRTRNPDPRLGVRDRATTHDARRDSFSRPPGRSLTGRSISGRSAQSFALGTPAWSRRVVRRPA